MTNVNITKPNLNQTLTTYATIVLLGLVLALWLTTRPYMGVAHDGLFYALQALNVLQPDIYSHDIFFLYGSQDQYTLFSNIYAFFIQHLGLGNGSVLLEILGLILWLLAAFSITRQLPSTAAAIMALLLIATSHNNYGSHQVLGYAESSLTARLYAELFSLAGLAAYLRQQYYLGSLAYALAFTMHPLMTLPAFIIGLGIAMQLSLWLGLCSGGIIIGIILGVLGIAPFNGLLQPMDTQWWQYNVTRSPFVFLHTWTWQALSQSLFVCLVHFVAWLLLPANRLKKLAEAILISTLGFFAVSLIGGSLLKLPLIIGLQLHRIMWIGVVTTPIFLVALLWNTQNVTSWQRFIAFGLSLGLLIDTQLQSIYTLFVIMIGLLGMKFIPNYQPKPLVWFCAALLPLQAIVFSLINLQLDVADHNFINTMPAWRLYLSHTIIAITLCFISYIGITHRRTVLQVLTSIGIFLLITFTTWQWLDTKTINFKSTAETFYDSHERQQAIAPIQQLIPRNAVVYWVESPERAWFWLQRANYVSFDQAAGAVFNRQTTIELTRRDQHVIPASLLDSRIDWNSHPNVEEQKTITTEIAQHLCHDIGIDFIIAKRFQSELKITSFADPITNTQYGAYHCQTL